MATLTGGAVYEDMDPPLVPESCCRQIAGASALNPVARSLARCQQPDADRKWRHTTVSGMEKTDQKGGVGWGQLPRKSDDGCAEKMNNIESARTELFFKASRSHMRC